MESLGNTSVSVYARAHDYIPQIIRQVERLVEKGYAYKISDGYYFDIKKFAGYGKLSGRTTLKPGDSVSRVDENSEKINPGDFCLWKFRKIDEPFWSAPFGEGRPWWHIEDTAITEHHFGAQYDIHGGAIDLIFPHHEAEITQMESISDLSPLVRYWLHTGFLNIKSEKMSKSTGNFVTIREILKNYNYRTLRYFFLSQHYRHTFNFTDESMEQASQGLARIQTFADNINENIDDSGDLKNLNEFKSNFIDRLSDDFNTPEAFALLFDFIRDQNKRGLSGKNTLELMKSINSVFEIISFDKTVKVPDAVQTLIDEREEARKAKDFEKSDRLRDEIKSHGFIIEDRPDGPNVCPS